MKNLLHSKTHPYRLFENASTRYAEGYEALQCDIKTILDSPRGQLLGKPEFGSYLHEALGDPVDATLKQKVEFEVRRALEDVYNDVIVRPVVEIVETTVIVHIAMELTSFSEVLEFVYEYERSSNG